MKDIETRVCAEIMQRKEIGKQKYGTTLAENPAALIERLQHLKEELLDGALYAQWVIDYIDDATRMTPWYPYYTKPVRVGVYQIKLGELIHFSYWNGDCWANQESSNEKALILKECRAFNQYKTWRGFTKEQA